MQQQALCIAIAISASFGWATAPISVEAEHQQLNLTVNAKNIDDRYINVTISNEDTVTAHCELQFFNGPQTVRKRKGSIDAGQQRLFTANLQRVANQLRVTVNCQPGDQ